MAKDKTISMAELLNMVKNGASVETEERPQIFARIQEAPPDKGPTTIEGFSELLAKLDQLLKAGEVRAVAYLAGNEARAAADQAGNEVRAAADLAGKKVQLEVIATLQKMIKSNNEAKPGSAGLAEVRSVLTEMQQENKRPAPATYEFDIKRTQQGYIDKITATPHVAATH